ncbi:hypothetical protein PG995_007840 [Apiospora arundinis]
MNHCPRDAEESAAKDGPILYQDVTTTVTWRGGLSKPSINKEQVTTAGQDWKPSGFPIGVVVPYEAAACHWDNYTRLWARV